MKLVTLLFGYAFSLIGLAGSPVVSAPSQIETVVGEEVSFRLLAEDPDGDPLSISSSNLPKGATFDIDTLEFSWIPDQYLIGKHEPVFTVSDALSVVTIKVPILVTDSPSSLDPFEPGSCAGTPMTEEQAISFFDTGASTSREFGEAYIHARTRSCNLVTGCRGWREMSSLPVYWHSGSNPRPVEGGYEFSTSEPYGPLQLSLTGGGTKILLKTRNNTKPNWVKYPQHDDYCASGCTSYHSSAGFNFECTGVGKYNFACTPPKVNFVTTYSASEIGYSQSYPHRFEVSWMVQRLKRIRPPGAKKKRSFYGDKFSVESNLTDHCLRIGSKTQTSRDDAGNWKEFQFAFLASF